MWVGESRAKLKGDTYILSCMGVGSGSAGSGLGCSNNLEKKEKRKAEGIWKGEKKGRE